jgi:hypothetical protein
VLVPFDCSDVTAGDLLDKTNMVCESVVALRAIVPVIADNVARLRCDTPVFDPNPFLSEDPNVPFNAAFRTGQCGCAKLD